MEFSDKNQLPENLQDYWTNLVSERCPGLVQAFKSVQAEQEKLQETLGKIENLYSLEPIKVFEKLAKAVKDQKSKDPNKKKISVNESDLLQWGEKISKRGILNDDPNFTGLAGDKRRMLPIVMIRILNKGIADFWRSFENMNQAQKEDFFPKLLDGVQGLLLLAKDSDSIHLILNCCLSELFGADQTFMQTQKDDRLHDYLSSQMMPSLLPGILFRSLSLLNQKPLVNNSGLIKYFTLFAKKSENPAIARMQQMSTNNFSLISLPDLEYFRQKAFEIDNLQYLESGEFQSDKQFMLLTGIGYEIAIKNSPKISPEEKTQIITAINARKNNELQINASARKAQDFVSDFTANRSDLQNSTDPQKRIQNILEGSPDDWSDKLEDLHQDLISDFFVNQPQALASITRFRDLAIDLFGFEETHFENQVEKRELWESTVRQSPIYELAGKSDEMDYWEYAFSVFFPHLESIQVGLAKKMVEQHIWQSLQMLLVPNYYNFHLTPLPQLETLAKKFQIQIPDFQSIERLVLGTFGSENFPKKYDFYTDLKQEIWTHPARQQVDRLLFRADNSAGNEAENPDYWDEINSENTLSTTQISLPSNFEMQDSETKFLLKKIEFLFGVKFEEMS